MVSLFTDAALKVLQSINFGANSRVLDLSKCNDTEFAYRLRRRRAGNCATQHDHDDHLVQTQTNPVQQTPETVLNHLMMSNVKKILKVC